MGEKFLVCLFLLGGIHAQCSEAAIRLVGGRTRCQGRVEVQHGGRWGTVCDDGWDLNDANVVCRQLRCGTATQAVPSARFGRGTGQIWLDDVACTGCETTLTSCRHPGYGRHNCNHGEDAGVVCREPASPQRMRVRLVGGRSRCQGRVEVFYGGSWGTVCDDSWGMNDANVVCRMMGCGTATQAVPSARFGRGTGQIWMDDVACTGRETSLVSCRHAGYGRHNCNHGEDAGVVCRERSQTLSAVRLVGGRSRCQGRVEVLLGNRWGTVCDDSWDLNDANVVCRMMACGAATQAVPSARFGRGTGQIWMDDVACTGRETSLASCRHPGYGRHNCNHGEDAGVVCREPRVAPTLTAVRLVGGRSRCQGRVEVLLGNRWGTVCDDSWGMTDANVVCRMVGCGAATQAVSNARFGQGTGQIWMDDVACTGRETSLARCRHPGYGRHNCNHGEDAGVVCRESTLRVRLAGGRSRCQGRVEVFYGGSWGTVCDDSWGMNDANVVCRMVGCGTATQAVPSARFGRGTGQIWMDDVACTGRETSLASCRHPGYGRHNCNHGEDAGVVCRERSQTLSAVRLVGGRSRCQGRVEVLYGNRWGTVCDDSWGMNDANVVCRMVGCGTATQAVPSARFGRGTGQIWMDDVACTGRETSLASCRHPGYGRHNCNHGEDAGVVCRESTLRVRLAGGRSRCQGRVEVFYGGSWGTVCDDSWDRNDANVVCRMVGCGAATQAVPSARFGRGTGQIWLDDVACTGRETSLASCRHPGYGRHNCNHGEDAGVVCQERSTLSAVRLVGGRSRCQGRVEVLYGNRWGTVCDDSWDLNDANVVCRMMACGAATQAVPSARFGRGTGQIWMDDVACTGRETSLASCRHPGYGRHNCNHGEDAGVVCREPRVAPTLSAVRLVGGRSRCQGRVEVLLGNRWGTVCDDSWGMNDANVVCRMVGCGAATQAVPSARFGQGTGQIWMDDVACTGRETSLARCRHPGYGRHNCNHGEDAGVVCRESTLRVRLAGGRSRCQGRVEVFYGGSWGTVCDDSWGMNDANVVCRMVGCGTATQAVPSARFGRGTGQIWMDDVACTGRETSLASCRHRGYGSHNCNHGEDAGVVCRERSPRTIRLVGGCNRCQGRVEVLRGSRWGTVCDDNWDMNDANVVCRQLRCGTAVAATTNARSGRGTGQIWLDDVACTGRETSLTSCRHRGYGTHNCSHAEDAGVVCRGS